MKRKRNWLLFMIVVMVWSLNWVVMKSALSQINPLSLVFWILTLSAATLAPITVLVRKDLDVDGKTVTKLLVLGLINSLMMVVTLIGLVNETSGIGAVLNYTQPLFVFLLSIVFLKGEASVSRLLGILMGFLGVVALSIERSAFSGSHAYYLLIVGAFLWAIMILYYKILLGKVNPVLTCFVQQGAGASLLLPVAMTLDFNSFRFPFELSYMLMVLYSSIFAYGVGTIIWIHLIREEDVTVLASSSYLVPAVAVVLGWIFLGENLEPQSVLGMTLILSGVCVVNRSRRA